MGHRLSQGLAQGEDPPLRDSYYRRGRAREPGGHGKQLPSPPGPLIWTWETRYRPEPDPIGISGHSKPVTTSGTQLETLVFAY